MKKKMHSLLAALLALTLISGCSAKYQDSAGSPPAAEPQSASVMTEKAALGTGMTRNEMAVEQDDMVVEEETAMDADAGEMNIATGGGGETSQLESLQPRKLVRNINLSIQTKEYDDDIAKLTGRVESVGGYIESSMMQGVSMYEEYGARSAYLTVRIPADKLDEFLGEMGDEFHVVRTESHTSDITDTYYDAQARLDSLTAQEKRLVELLDGATELQYMLEVEREIANVRYQIESLYSHLQRMDSQVNLSTVWIDLQEVMEYKPVERIPENFAERVGRAFAGTWKAFALAVQDGVVFIIWNLPSLLILTGLAAIALVIIRKFRRGRKERQGTGQLPTAAEQGEAPPVKEQETDKEEQK